VNARQAMPEGGELSIALDRVRVNDLECHLGTRISGDYVRLRVSDSGEGVEGANLPRIFDPF
ncbi:MAG: hypothetical protein GWO39_02115, partial [Gammaproteobacteria bacterium]|nr:hypothetical protein [Gammaproteobacteria bacterium]NIT62626.1 hypothetical protein [Gammaproteobacteria bacterium]NIV19582.1 hypothetical protein [Gammaproteobacteria bacterium]NIY31206.1 hypothetical protein [Gammaproteobacteria bacterium]